MAISKGPYIKKQDYKAISYVWVEALKKKEDRYYNIYKQSDFKTNYSLQLKILPITAILHKSRPFRIIQDLFFSIKLNKTKLLSVNKMMIILLPKDAFQYIGLALLRLIFALAQAYETKLVYFAKDSIEDSYWRIFME